MVDAAWMAISRTAPEVQSIEILVKEVILPALFLIKNEGQPDKFVTSAGAIHRNLERSAHFAHSCVTQPPDAFDEYRN